MTMTIEAGSNSNANIESPEVVLSLLARQADLFRRLQTLAHRQRSLIEGDNTDPLISLLADRQHVTAELSKVGDRIGPIRKEWQSHRERFSPDDARRADQLLQEISDRMKRVIDSGQEDARLLSLRLKQAAVAIDSTVSSQTALTAYGASQITTSRLD